MAQDSTSEHDAIALAARLIQCPSVTPEASLTLDIVADALVKLGFTCTRLPFGDVDNLFATRGSGTPHFAFGGHVDVVPIGNSTAWQDEPFGGVIRDDALWGRGAADMKAAIAAFITAIAEYDTHTRRHNGTISLIITGDEEGPAINGTRKMVDWIRTQNIQIDDCLIGEPTNPTTLGEMIKIGRRGSLNGIIHVAGTQGHVAYPDLADNPLPRLLSLLQHLQTLKLDDGHTHFQPSNLEITSCDVGNFVHNVIAATANARFNIRFNAHWQGERLAQHIRTHLNATNIEHIIELDVTGEAFITEPCALTDKLTAAIIEVTGCTPQLSTSGGTSDARFIKDIARVSEFGLIEATMHQIDEHIPLTAIPELTKNYRILLESYFAG